MIVIHKGKVALAKLLITRDIKLHETDRFAIKDLSYHIEGIDWHLRYKFKKFGFDILFRPLNEFYSYPRDMGNATSLFSHHIEQAGTFEGKMEINGNRIKFGPAFGHRDHS